MRSIVTWITLALLLLSSCSGFRAIQEKTDPTPGKVNPTPQKMTPAEIEQAKQDIYRVVASQACGDRVVHIYPEVALYPLYDSEIEYAPKEIPGAFPETWANYRSVNDPNQGVIKFSDFPINCEYEFVSITDVICAGPETNCITPYGFSGIGFNAAGTQALVYMFRDCTECGGGGSILFLEKKDGNWAIIDAVALWVS